jgi:hypothetical protein
VDNVEKFLSQCVGPWNPARAPRLAEDWPWCDSADALNRPMERGIFVERARRGKTMTVYVIADIKVTGDGRATNRLVRACGRTVVAHIALGDRLPDDGHRTEYRGAHPRAACSNGYE